MLTPLALAACVVLVALALAAIVRLNLSHQRYMRSLTSEQRDALKQEMNVPGDWGRRL